MVSNIHSHACWTLARRIRSIRSATVCGALGLRFALESRVVEVQAELPSLQHQGQSRWVVDAECFSDFFMRSVAEAESPESFGEAYLVIAGPCRHSEVSYKHDDEDLQQTCLARLSDYRNLDDRHAENRRNYR